MPKNTGTLVIGEKDEYSDDYSGRQWATNEPGHPEAVYQCIR